MFIIRLVYSDSLSVRKNGLGRIAESDSDVRHDLLMAILAAYPSLRMIHVFLDNARYHHARLVREWLAREGGRITLHFIPTYSPHLNPIERLWGVMHQNVTHNKCYATFRDFKTKMMTFLTRDVPRNWDALRDSVTDNFRVINPSDFRVLK